MIHINYVEYTSRYLDVSVQLGRTPDVFAFAIIELLSVGADIFLWIDKSGEVKDGYVDSIYRNNTAQKLISEWEEDAQSKKHRCLSDGITIDDSAPFSKPNTRYANGERTSLRDGITAQQSREVMLQQTKSYPIKDFIMAHVGYR